MRRFVRSMLASGVGSAVVYLLVLWDHGIAPFRTAVGNAAFANFYDAQARALMHGRLALPPGTLGIEAFVVGGRELMYFPPGPSLLRIPLFLFTSRFDNRVTALSMLLAWIVTAVLTSLLLWRVRRIMRGDEPLSRVEAAGYALLLATVNCGSVVLFLGALPWVYHEAYAWAIAMAIGAAHCLLGLLERPSASRVLTTGLFTLGAVLSRTTTGWACGVTVVLTSLWFLTGRGGAGARHRWWLVALAGAVPLGVGIGLNWAKFRHPYLFPLQNQVWTQINDHRRAALAANGGDLISFNIFPSTVVNYFRPNGIRFIPIFPFITLPPVAARSYGGGFLDQTYRTGSVTNFMPMLLLLTIWGLIAVVRPRGPKGAALARLPILAVLAIPVGTMFYGYIAYRYTSEFVPLLVVAGAIGYTDLARRLTGRSARARSGAIVVMAVLTLFGIASNGAVAVTASTLTNPEAKLLGYTIAQERISLRTGHPLDGFAAVSSRLPDTGRAEHIQIVGPCNAWYVATGESGAPWELIEARDVAFDVTVVGSASLPAGMAPLGELKLAEFDGLHPTDLVLSRSGRSRYRLSLDDGVQPLHSNWFEVAEGSTFTVIIRVDKTKERFRVETPNELPLEIDMSAWDPNFARFPTTVDTRVQSPEDALRQGLAIKVASTPPLPWCDRLLARLTQRSVSGVRPRT